MHIDLQNLYINPKFYKTEYNFYNYSKYKQTQTVPIIYKTPSIFLNGLHFELPPSNIIGIYKSADSQVYKLQIKISRQDFQSEILFDDILDVFKKIEDYNTGFFEKNSAKMDIKISRTLKNNTTSDTDLPVNRFKNPIARKLEYKPFYELLDDNNILMMLEIKQQYLSRIIQSQYLMLTNRHIGDLDNQSEQMRVYINQIEHLNEILNMDFFELKKQKIEMNLFDHPVSIRLWIKCNMLSLESHESRISMRWKICYYDC